MCFLRPIQWYHSHADPIWPDGTFKLMRQSLEESFFEGGDASCVRVLRAVLGGRSVHTPSGGPAQLTHVVPAHYQVQAEVKVKEN